MAEDIRVWRIAADNQLREIPKRPLDLEARIERWIERDIDILSPDLLVIGNQVPTDFGGFIDLLCIDRDGNLVIVELKRDCTPREVTAQALDYASWAKDLATDRIASIANSYLAAQGQGTLEQAFQEKFNAELPEVINESHSVLIVASQIDSSTERIINYLSGTFGVGINAARFCYFRDDLGGEFLARTFVVEPHEAEQRTRTRGSSKRTTSTWEQLRDIAKTRGVIALYDELSSRLETSFFLLRRKSVLAYAGEMPDGQTNAILKVLPEQSSPEAGLCFQLYTERLARYCDVPAQVVLGWLPGDLTPYTYYPDAPADLRGVEGYFRSEEDIVRFAQALIATPGIQRHAAAKAKLTPGQKASKTKKAKAAVADD